MSRRLRVAFVGGVGRLEREIVAAGEAVGVDVEVHDGSTRSATRARLASIVQRTDVVVIVTGVNSHGAVRVAKEEAHKTGAPLRILKFCGASTARALLSEIAQHAHAA